MSSFKIYRIQNSSTSDHLNNLNNLYNLYNRHWHQNFSANDVTWRASPRERWIANRLSVSGCVRSLQLHRRAGCSAGLHSSRSDSLQKWTVLNLFSTVDTNRSISICVPFSCSCIYINTSFGVHLLQYFVCVFSSFIKSLSSSLFELSVFSCFSWFVVYQNTSKWTWGYK